MNFLLRLVERLRLVWLAARGLETGVVSPLPRPLVDPALTAADLAVEAERNGVADGRAITVDGWSFGGPEAPVSDVYDPSFVRRLREERETALATIYQCQAINTSRVAHVRRWRDESEDLMDSARAMMTGIAVREARMEELTIRGSQARAGVDITAEDLPDVAPNDLRWEGETNPLGLGWRLVILAGLVLAELPVQFFVYDYFLSGNTSTDVIRALSVSTAAFMVFGPNVAGLLLRSRQATGAERRIGWAVLALAVPWLFVAVVLGVVRAAILSVDPTRIARLNITPQTVMLMFVALMLIIGAMSFMLGLARRHPSRRRTFGSATAGTASTRCGAAWPSGSTRRTATSPSRARHCSTRTSGRSGRRTRRPRRHTSRLWCARSEIRYSPTRSSSDGACDCSSSPCRRQRRNH